MPPQGDVLEFRIAPDSRFVAYRADRAADNVFDLHGALLDGRGSPRKLNGPLATGGDVQSDFVVLLGGRVLYRADQDAAEVFEETADEVVLMRDRVGRVIGLEILGYQARGKGRTLTVDTEVLGEAG